VQSQYDLAPIFTTGDQIDLQLNADGTYYHLHEVKKGHTLYSLSKIFGYSLDQMMQFNRKSEPTVTVGEKIKIPIGESKIIKNKSELKHGENIYVPVSYTAKPKDNLYRIARIYFKQDMDKVMARNNMDNTSIQEGQSILLGWYAINVSRTTAAQPDSQTTAPSTSTTTTTITTTTTTTNVAQGGSTTATAGKPHTDYKRVPLTAPTLVPTRQQTTASSMITNESIDSIMLETVPTDVNILLLGEVKYSDDMKLVDTKAVAQWNKNIPDNGELYVLHNTAAVDTYMELYNDLVKRSVRAKVIGKIPFGAYTSDVKLIVSPRAAQALGALNERFRVSVKYYK